MQTLKKTKSIGIKSYVIPFVSLDGFKSIAILSWGKDKKVFVAYLYAFMQDNQIAGDYLPQSLMQDLNTYCDAKGLNLHSF